MKKLYLAPLEGVTDSIYRNAFLKYYGGVEKVFTPFLSPNSTHKFTTREFKDINPQKNDINLNVPQLLTNNPEHFLWAAGEIIALGYTEINLNLGCPSGTVVAKKKGSGLLFYPEELDKFLYEIFNKLEGKCSLSIKTRLGKHDPEEFYEILEIYNKYPVSELTIHPRIQSDFYKEPVRMEYFDYAYQHAKAPLVYNGEVKTVSDIETIEEKYPDIAGIMIGRGLITNPELGLQYKGINPTSNIDINKLKELHRTLLQEYSEALSGEKPVLHRMKEFWSYWQTQFPNDERAIKKIKKSNKLQEYKDYVAQLMP
ncbi:MAG: tRNA-dihydrouridine synthase family protein [Pseudobutyrivibrio sp.]|nr:tRNA-dihydrouridine synthase family protein [Pseudobutyrivibrio sp.]